MELKRVFKMERRKERKREQFTSQDCTSQFVTSSFLLRNPTYFQLETQIARLGPFSIYLGHARAPFQAPFLTKL